MAEFNDYTIICQKSKKYFELLETEYSFDSSKLSDKKKERFGFYLFMLEHLSELNDISDIVDCITDTEFNSLLFNDKSDDYGVDAIIIDEKNRAIQLYNFKYREEFKIGKQSLNETILSSKFFNAIINEDTSGLASKTKKGAKKIIEILKKAGEWKIFLYVISNENFELATKDEHLKQLEKVYGLDVVTIGLEQIRELISLRPKPISAKLILDNEAVMSFDESALASSRSYIIRLPLSEVVRITSNDKLLRENHAIEDLNPLKDVDLDYSVLFDNVRGLVVKSKYNKNISSTLKARSTKFFMFNNGLTITAKDITAVPANANKKVILTINSFQVLNGGQTLRTIHLFNKENSENLEKYLANSEVLVRIFKIADDLDLNNMIAEFTNSQNSISNIDLKSLRSEQLQIEQFLNTYGIVYSRKSGDTGLDENKSYKHKISMERFGQILMSFRGMPERATNQKKAIFEKYYEELFLSEDFHLEECPELVEKYFSIRKEYEVLKNKIEVSEQKIFYVIYMSRYLQDTIENLINLLEQMIEEFEPSSGKKISAARKLIQLDFKIFLDTKLMLNA